MPEYLAPGVYIEETSYRSKSIEGVSTTTTGFIGPTRYGPIDIEPDIITSLGEFERIYGDGQPLTFGSTTTPNYLWHAARAFFAEGGRRLYVVRCFASDPADTDGGHASAKIPEPVDGEEAPTRLVVRARFPGAVGDMRVRISLRWGPNVLSSVAGQTTLGALTVGDVVWLSPGTKLLPTGPNQAPSRVEPDHELYLASRSFDALTGGSRWVFTNKDNETFTLDNGQESNREARAVTLSVMVSGTSPGSQTMVWDGLAFGNDHIGPSGLRDGITALFEAKPASAALARTLPIAVEVAGNATTALNLAALLKVELLASGSKPGVLSEAMDIATFIGKVRAAAPHDGLDAAELKRALVAAFSLVDDPNTPNYPFRQPDVDRALSLQVPAAEVNGISVEQQFVDAFKPGGLVGLDFSEAANSIDLELKGGNDGKRPDISAYEGKADDTSVTKTGLKAFEDIEDISIVAAPGYSDPWGDDAQAIQGALLAHARFMRYRIAVLDSGKGTSGEGMTIAEVRQQRGAIDSTYGALYYPWVRVMDPITREPIHLPPSGFVAGIYARNDIERAVYKAPANEVVNLAIGFEQLLNKSQQDVLNPEGINCFRFFEGRGYRLWGARTVSSDPEWKYVNLRRYFAYLERSIDKGTQWVVFEPNGDRLWANVRRTIEDFLFNEWQNGALLGDKPERAYFVKCDRSTMTQNDLDNGRLVCQIGVAALRPAEFVIFRIGQWTGDRRS